MTDETAHVEALVEIWADWARDDMAGLGYPSLSTAYRAMEQKRSGAIWGKGRVPQPKDDSGRRAAGQHSVSMSKDVQAVETAMTFMPVKYQRVLHLKYVCCWMNDHQRAREMIKFGVKMTRQGYSEAVKRGLFYLMGTLDMRAGQRAALDELTRQAQDLGMGY